MTHASKKELQKAAIKKAPVSKKNGRDQLTPLHETFEATKMLCGPYLKRTRLVRDDWARYELALKYPVRINGRMKNNIPFVTIVENKTSVTVTVAPLGYVDVEIPSILAELQVGKSSFKITKSTPPIRTAFRAIIKAGFEGYKSLGWIVS